MERQVQHFAGPSDLTGCSVSTLSSTKTASSRLPHPPHRPWDTGRQKKRNASKQRRRQHKNGLLNRAFSRRHGNPPTAASPFCDTCLQRDHKAGSYLPYRRSRSTRRRRKRHKAKLAIIILSLYTTMVTCCWCFRHRTPVAPLPLYAMYSSLTSKLQKTGVRRLSLSFRQRRAGWRALNDRLLISETPLRKVSKTNYFKAYKWEPGDDTPTNNTQLSTIENRGECGRCQPSSTQEKHTCWRSRLHLKQTVRRGQNGGETYTLPRLHPP